MQSLVSWTAKSFKDCSLSFSRKQEKESIIIVMQSRLAK